LGKEEEGRESGGEKTSEWVESERDERWRAIEIVDWKEKLARAPPLEFLLARYYRRRGPLFGRRRPRWS